LPHTENILVLLCNETNFLFTYIVSVTKYFKGKITFKKVEYFFAEIVEVKKTWLVKLEKYYKSPLNKTVILHLKVVNVHYSF